MTRGFQFLARGILVGMLSAAGVLADATTVTLQRGLDGCDGVADTFLYAPQSVANINYGQSRHLTAGINRWGEHYVALIRFDLSSIPRAAKVKQASLWLYDTSKDSPARELAMDVSAIAVANGAWSEGTGDGTRVPIEGTPCWNYLRYDTKPWAGDRGLRKAGVDYVQEPLASALVKKGHAGWVEFVLRPEAVQGWVSDPKTNAGMRVYPLGAKDKGDMFGCHSSEVGQDASLRPKLVLQLEMDAATAEAYRRNRAMRAAKAVQALLEEAVKKVSIAGHPARVEPVLKAAAGQVASVQKEIQSRPLETDASLKQMMVRVRKVEEAIGRVLLVLTQARAAAANAARNRATDFALGVADSMTNVLRLAGRFEGDFPPCAEIELARNEFEAVQVVLVPIDADVEGATWSVSALRGPDGATIPAGDVSVAVMGYLKSRKPAIETKVAWWPGPVLDFMKRVDVRRGEVQPLWVCVRTREDTRAGAYRGSLVVKAAGGKGQSIDLCVRVFDFVVPKEQHLLNVWGNNEATFKRLYGDRYDKTMARAMFDFLIDHRLSVTTLYSAQAAGRPASDGWFQDCIGYPTLSEPGELKRLWEKGSRWWNLGYLHPGHAKQAGMEFDAYVGKFIEMMRSSLQAAEAAGWPRSNLAIYFFDETRDFATLNKAAARVKEAFGDIALMTTGYDRSYGVKGGPIDQSIDIWCPLTPRFAEDEPVIRKGRKAGKKVWWYVCCGPRGRGDLNFFCQFPAIRSRLLMGAATWKYRPDGFLYYRVSGWRYKKPLDDGPLTAWEPYYLPGPDGDGELICPGPDGPLTTLQFENIRDGIEDFEYYWVLKDRVDRCRRRGVDVSAEEKLLGVPGDLLSSLRSYSEEPARLRAERRKVAEAIVRLAQKEK